MASSDNTIRAGLTPKHIDVNTLCEMLNYSPAPASSKIFPCVQDAVDPCVTLYDPPVPDFTVMRIQVGDFSVYALMRRLNLRFFIKLSITSKKLQTTR